MSGLSKIGVFSLGLTAGAVLGLLLAPETGEDARAYLSRAVRRGVERAAEEGSKWVQRAQDVAEQMSDKAQDFTGRVRDAYGDAKESVS
ncbi:MAG TPA: YtxH domain-containing protein [Candidatus Acidoferrales bacterium]|nr:YtxH domain-containing protein [Candidatus Acidoferrales bacterium]